MEDKCCIVNFCYDFTVRYLTLTFKVTCSITAKVNAVIMFSFGSTFYVNNILGYEIMSNSIRDVTRKPEMEKGL